MNTIRMIAIDLDDTLLRDDISISDYTKTTLRKAMDRGVKIVIATGRMFQAARPWGQAIGLGDVPMICYTGSLTGLCESGQILRDVTINKDLALDILATIKEFDWYAHTYIKDELYVAEYTKETEDYEKQCGVTAHVVGEEFYHPEAAPTKILVCDYDPSQMGVIGAVLKEKYGKLVNQVKSKPYFFEMNNQTCSKGEAVSHLAEQWNIPLDQVMTFGNGNNDVSMLQLTPWSFAVANASASAKQAAARVTLSNNEDGVARAVAKYVLRA